MLRRFHKDETGQALVEYLIGITTIARGLFTSVKNGVISVKYITTEELVVVACVFIVVVFVVSRLFGQHR